MNSLRFRRSRALPGAARAASQPPLPNARVHVLLTSYNRRDYLAESIESVMAQTFQDFHVLVVDDASPDGAAEVAREYARSYPDHVSAICKPARRGLTDSMNLGLSLMRHVPYVALLADDDRWHMQKLEFQLEQFANDRTLGLVATDAVVIDAQGEPIGETFSDICGVPNLDETAQHVFNHGNFLCAPSVMVTQEALRLVDYRYPIAGVCNDMYMWLVISAHIRVAWMQEPLTYYRRTDSSLTVTREAEVRHETFALRRVAFERYPRVREAVGGAPAKARLEREALSWGMWHLHRMELREYLWYARDVVMRSGSPSTIARLVSGTVRSGFSFAVKRIYAALRRRNASE